MNERRLPVACAAVVLAVALTGALACAELSADPAQRNAQWIDDIDYLVARLQIVHPDVYAYNAPGEFDQAVADLKRRVPTDTDNEIVMGLHELMGLIHDAHSSIVPWREGQCAVTDTWRAYPVTYYRFRDGLYVLAASDTYRDLVGRRVVRVGDVTPDEALARMGRFVGADNAQGRLVMGSLYLLVAEALEYAGITSDPDHLTVRLADADGREIEHTLEPESFAEALASFYQMGKDVDGRVIMNETAPAPLPLYLTRPGDAYWFEYLPEHEAMYVCLLDMELKADEDFEAFYGRLFAEIDAKGAKTLILDVRNNGGGDHYEMPLLKGVIARPHLDDREHLFVITGRTTVSASQHFVTQFELYTNATFVGEPTSAKPNFYGAQRFFNLPNSGLTVRSSVIFHQDATGWEMVGTTHPDYLVELSADDFAANRDPVLDLILDFDRYADLPAQLKAALAKAYETDGAGALDGALQAFLAAHPQAHLDEYAFFGDFIWWMFEHKQSVEDYGTFLDLYTQRCPDASGAWYSLGIRRRNAGDPEAAVHCFDRSLAAYPGNRPARMERDLILFEQERQGR